MLGLICAASLILCVICIIFAISSICNKLYDELKREIIWMVIFALIAVGSYIGCDYLVKSTYIETKETGKYQLINLRDDTFLYKAENNAIREKWFNNESIEVYQSENGDFYAIENTTYRKGKIDEFWHGILTFERTNYIKQITYEIYMPKEEYEKYLAR